jgi:ketosteroid isomerase-like protein
MTGNAARDPAIQELLDKQAIREAVMRYCRGVDRCDADLIKSAYHPDARDEQATVTHTGEAIGSYLATAVPKSMASTNHNVGTQNIEINGDLASVETYMQGNHLLKDRRRVNTRVRYLDRFERRNGEWKIIHRRTITESMDVLPPVEPDAVFNPPLGGSRDKDDLSYTLFKR